jgi:mono/diheme cytochrome c family protein
MLVQPNGWAPRSCILAVALVGCASTSDPLAGVSPPGSPPSQTDGGRASADGSVAEQDAASSPNSGDAGEQCTTAARTSGIVAHPGHSENVPPEYAGRLDPYSQISAVIATGAALYQPRCVSCHGETGRGDGPDWNKYHPRPAGLTAIVDHSDASLLWRVSESGFMPPLCSAMPGYKRDLTEDERWRLITFLRTLGEAPPFELDAGATPLPPSMTYLTVVGNALHAAWMLQSACDSINVIRSENGAADKALASLVGNASTHNDTNVTKDGMYCYRVQCSWAGKVSAPSGALCGSVAFPDGGMDMDAMP